MAFTLSGDVATTRTNLGLGDAATKTTGTASGNIPVLDSSGQIADAQIAALSVSKLSGVGTTGQVLTSTGTTTAPTMQDAAGGADYADYFRGYFGTNTSVSNGNVFNWGSSTSTTGSNVTESGGRFTCASAGVYLIQAKLSLSTGTGTINVKMRVNASEQPIRLYREGAGSYDSTTNIWIVNVAANAIFDLICKDGQTYYGTASSHDAMCQLTGIKIG